MKKTIKTISCVLAFVIVSLLLSSCFVLSDKKTNNNDFEQLQRKTIKFESVDELDSFFKGSRRKLEGSFLCLDLSSEDGIYIQDDSTFPFYHEPYTFEYEVKDKKYINSRLCTYYTVYSEELGSDKYEDAPYHSLTLQLYSYPQSKIDNDLRYEFFSCDNKETRWNYVVKIYSGDTCVADMYYYTKLNIEHEWLTSFLNKYIVVVNKKTLFDLFNIN